LGSPCELALPNAVDKCRRNKILLPNNIRARESLSLLNSWTVSQRGATYSTFRAILWRVYADFYRRCDSLSFLPVLSRVPSKVTSRFFFILFYYIDRRNNNEELSMLLNSADWDKLRQVFLMKK